MASFLQTRSLQLHALDWMRNKGASPTDFDESMPGFDRLGSVPVSCCSHDDRAKDLDDAWINVVVALELCWPLGDGHDGHRFGTMLKHTAK